MSWKLHSRGFHVPPPSKDCMFLPSIIIWHRCNRPITGIFPVIKREENRSHPRGLVIDCWNVRLQSFFSVKQNIASYFHQTPRVTSIFFSLETEYRRKEIGLMQSKEAEWPSWVRIANRRRPARMSLKTYWKRRSEYAIVTRVCCLLSLLQHMQNHIQHQMLRHTSDH